MFKDFTVKRPEYLPCLYDFSFTNMSFYGKIAVLHLLDGMNFLIKLIWW